MHLTEYYAFAAWCTYGFASSSNNALTRGGLLLAAVEQIHYSLLTPGSYSQGAYGLRRVLGNAHE